MRTRPGNSDLRLPLERRLISFAQSLPSAEYDACASRSGSQWTSGKACVHLEREAAVRRRDECPAADAERFPHESALPVTISDVLDDGVREHDVELAVRKRKRQRVALDVADARVTLAEALAFVESERGDALGPRIELLEEVERAAAVALAEPELVGADVEHGRLASRLQLVEEELELAPPGAHRYLVSQSHGRKYRLRARE